MEQVARVGLDVGGGVEAARDAVPPGRRRLALAAPAGALLCIVVVVTVTTVVLAPRVRVVVPGHVPTAWEAGLSAVVALLIALPGAAVIAVRPGNPIGWLLVGGVLLDVTGDLFAALGLLGIHGGATGLEAGRWWATASEALQRPEFVLPLVVLLLFPTGHVPSPRWRPLLWGLVTLAVVWFLAHLLESSPLDEDPFAGQPSAWHTPAWLEPVVGAHVFLPLAGIGAILTVSAVVVRYRHSAGLERQQLCWLGPPLALVPLALVALSVAEVVGPRAMNVAGNLVFVTASFLLPVCVAVAITRYRLYDLDLLVNRTVVYGAVCLVVAGVYGLVVVGLTALVAHVGPRSPVVVASATLVAAAVFAPLRRRVQVLVDRSFSRRAWAAERILRDLSEASRHRPVTVAALQDSLRRALGDDGAVVGVRLRARGVLVGTDGSLAPPSPGEVEVGLGSGAEPPAVVRVRPDVVRDRRLVLTVRAASALVAENVRLQAEVDDRVAEVERSRARILAASDEMRRQVERDLHDGAQQHLVGLALTVRLQARRTEDAFLVDVEREILAAAAELRELARGVNPPALDAGLGPAVRVVASRMPVPVQVDLAPAELSTTAALTAYYVVCEALTNAVRHAGASLIRVVGRRSSGSYEVVVTDDGRGGASLTGGTGLAGLRDRAAAAGGELRVESRADGTTDGAVGGVRGTVIRLRLPCG